MRQFFDTPLASHSTTVRTRFVPVMHLTSGESVTLFAESEKRFEERAVFGRAARAAERSEPASPSQWLAGQVERIANDAHNRTDVRPVIIPAPLATLLDDDTALACDAAIRRTRLCPQEICIEIKDAALALPSKDAQTGIEALRRVGFRVSLDATRSWQAPLSTALRLLLDSIRIDASLLELEPELEKRVEAASACGMSVIAEKANWRDGDYLASMGIEYGMRPRADG
jgi:EAL domain-containing protein (putative c-di-GMP-specific phosphodiesterase class I)